MDDIVALMKNMPDFYAMNGAADEEIKYAEEMLGVQFAEDYRQYVSALGVASFGGHELTGVCRSKRLNVVGVTQEERSQYEDIPINWYVIEQANIDGIVIWQAPSGEIYQTGSGTSGHKLCDSLSEYISGNF